MYSEIPDQGKPQRPSKSVPIYPVGGFPLSERHLHVKWPNTPQDRAP